jgi:hypothetical protein
MKFTTTHALAIAAVLSASVGCQSGPRWAWWKTDKDAADASAVARTAAPTLPSAQSTPQAVEPAGLQPAAPPSSANLASAGTQTPRSVAIPVAPPTIAHAPLANYPSIASTSGTTPATAAATTPAPFGASPTAGIASPTAATSAPQVAASNLPSGPYDPNAYQPPTSPTATPSAATEIAGETPSRYPTPSSNRYGTATSGMTEVAAAPATPQPMSASTTNATTTPGTTPSYDRYGLGSATTASTQPMGTTPNSTTQPPMTPVTSITPIENSSTASGAVQVATAPGQYRPGGTLSYVGTQSSGAVEVATRPAPAATTSAAPATTTAPTNGSVPWTPPTTRTY